MGKQLRADKGGRPFVVQPELTEGCSMRFGSGPGGLCSFCGLTAIRTGPGEYKWMSIETAEKLAAECGLFCPQARVEFAMRGEPLMNPKHLEIFRLFRRFMPRTQLMVTTNGDTLRNRMQKAVDTIFDTGLNFILLDTRTIRKIVVMHYARKRMT